MKSTDYGNQRFLEDSLHWIKHDDLLTPVHNFITWDEGRVTDTGEICNARLLKGSLASPKIVHRIGCWNVRAMYIVGQTAQVTSEMQRCSVN